MSVTFLTNEDKKLIDQSIEKKVNNAGWTAGKLIGTDSNGNIVALDDIPSEEKLEIIQAVRDAIKVENPEVHVIYGDIGADNTITVYGDVADGVYTVKYENADGTVTDIGTLTIGDESGDTVKVPITWILRTKLSKTTGEVESTDEDNYNASDFITLVPYASYTISTATDTYNAVGVVYYDSNKAFISFQADCWSSNDTVEDPEDGTPQECALVIPDGAAYIRLRQFETWNEQGGSTEYITLTYTMS